MNIKDLTTGQNFQIDDFPGMTLVAWGIRTEGGMTTIDYKIADREMRFDRFSRPSLSTVYPV